MADMIKLGGLWSGKDKDGNTFLSGKFSPQVKIEELRQYVSYDPQTGVFSRGGKVLGWTTLNGYRSIYFKGKTLLAHRVAWAIVHSAWPKGEVDHINGDRTDNRIANLRDLSHSGNQQNVRRAQKNNRLGILGVCRVGKRFQAVIYAKGKPIYLGLYDTPEQAHAAYLEAKRELHATCTI